MNIIVISGKNTRPTARKIAKAMEGLYLKETSVAFKYWNGIINTDLLINYGCQYEHKFNADIILNTHQSILNAANKKAMFRILQDAEIPTPPELPLESNEMGYYRAKDNHVYLRDFQREGDLYKTAPLDIDREYRVLVFQDNVYATMLKKPKHYTSDFNLKFLGRKLDTCNFIYVKPRPRLLKLCKATMNALGLTFAGIDIALTTDNQMYAIEANSAPGLGEKNLNLFIEQLKNYLERQEL